MDKDISPNWLDANRDEIEEVKKRLSTIKEGNLRREISQAELDSLHWIIDQIKENGVEYLKKLDGTNFERLYVVDQNRLDFLVRRICLKLHSDPLSGFTFSESLMCILYSINQSLNGKKSSR